MTLLALLLAAVASAGPGPGFAVRAVKLSGPPAGADTKAHVRYCRELGFNALFVDSRDAGVWTQDDAPAGPRLDPDFVRLTRWCRRNGMDLFVAIHPVKDSLGRFVYTDPERERRLLQFVKTLGETAGVRRFVLALDDAPTQLRELSDIFRFGASSAPAHLELTRRVASALPAGSSLWLFARASCDAQLSGGEGPYAKPFLEGLAQLPPDVGLVWTGPSVLSQTITREDLIASRARLAGRPLILYDNFPTDEDGDEGDAIALVLGVLRGRDPGIKDVLAAYVAVPSRPLPGSRLSLAATASFLRDPSAYHPDTARTAAIARMAGRDPAATGALDTQQLEWGGALSGRNYWPRSLLNPELAAGRLHDPAFVDSFTWTVARYPDRMAALAKLADAPFRDALLRMMRRRLAIARAMPLTVEYLARVRKGDPEAAAVLAQIDDLRRSLRGDADAGRILESFLTAAQIPAAKER